MKPLSPKANFSACDTYVSHRKEEWLRWANYRASCSGIAPAVTGNRPETLPERLSQPDTLRSGLQTIPPRDPKGLRDDQIEAIQGLKVRLADDRRARSFSWRAGRARRLWSALHPGVQCRHLMDWIVPALVH